MLFPSTLSACAYGTIGTFMARFAFNTIITTNGELMVPERLLPSLLGTKVSIGRFASLL
jgi:hypothetical protein